MEEGVLLNLGHDEGVLYFTILCSEGIMPVFHVVSVKRDELQHGLVPGQLQPAQEESDIHY